MPLAANGSSGLSASAPANPFTAASEVANGAPLSAYAAVQRPELFAAVNPPFGEESYYAWAARKGDDSTALVAEINRILVKLQDDGRLGELQKKWFGEVIALPKEMPAFD